MIADRQDSSGVVAPETEESPARQAAARRMEADALRASIARAEAELDRLREALRRNEREGTPKCPACGSTDVTVFDIGIGERHGECNECPTCWDPDGPFAPDLLVVDKDTLQFVHTALTCGRTDEQASAATALLAALSRHNNEEPPASGESESE